MKILSEPDKAKVVALIARGDKTHQQIGKEMGVSASAISQISMKNKDAIISAKSQIAEYKTAKVARLLDKTHDLIDKRLSKAELADQRAEEYAEQYEDGEIDNKKYYALMRSVKQISNADLIAMSREMFTQSEKTDPDDPASKSVESQKKQLMELMQGLKDGDEVILERLTFNK